MPKYHSSTVPGTQLHVIKYLCLQFLFFQLEVKVNNSGQHHLMLWSQWGPLPPSQAWWWCPHQAPTSSGTVSCLGEAKQSSWDACSFRWCHWWGEGLTGPGIFSFFGTWSPLICSTALRKAAFFSQGQAILEETVTWELSATSPSKWGNECLSPDRGFEVGSIPQNPLR